MPIHFFAFQLPLRPVETAPLCRFFRRCGNFAALQLAFGRDA